MGQYYRATDGQGSRRLTLECLILYLLHTADSQYQKNLPVSPAARYRHAHAADYPPAPGSPRLFSFPSVQLSSPPSLHLSSSHLSVPSAFTAPALFRLPCPSPLTSPMSPLTTTSSTLPARPLWPWTSLIPTLFPSPLLPLPYSLFPLPSPLSQDHTCPCPIPYSPHSPNRYPTSPLLAPFAPLPILTLSPLDPRQALPAPPHARLPPPPPPDEPQHPVPDRGERDDPDEPEPEVERDVVVERLEGAECRR